MCQVNPSSAVRLEMETCSGAGVELRPWGKNDKGLLLFTEGPLHFRRCLVQLRGLIFSISSHLIRASSCVKDCPVISRLLHICCTAEFWEETSRAEMGRQKRNASRVQAFHAFPPHGHVMLCQIRALQLWLSTSLLPRAGLWPSTVFPARED